MSVSCNTFNCLLCLIILYFVVSKVAGNEVRETDSPTPPLLVNNHLMNNIDYNKEDVKENSFNEENHIASRYTGPKNEN